MDTGAFKGGLTIGILVPTDVVLVNDDIVVDVAPVTVVGELPAAEVLHPADRSTIEKTRVMTILRICDILLF
jgi:hypothetical protein